MQRLLSIAAVGAVLVFAARADAQPRRTSTDITPPAAIAFIREADLKRDMYALAGDAMRGREAGTIDEMRASMWVADEMRKIGVTPMGEDGTWFQWFNMRRTRISTGTSSVRVGGRDLALWKEIAPTSNAAADVSAPTVFVTDLNDTTIDVRGRVAIAVITAPAARSIRTTTNTYEHNYARAAINAMGNALTRRGAAGVILVADSIADIAFDAIATLQPRGTYDVVGGAPRFNRAAALARIAGTTPAAPATQGQAPAAPVLLVRRNSLGALQSNGQPVEIHIRRETFDYPSVNVIGVVRGTDPALRDEYVLFSSHQDHDGVRYTLAGDSIWNGADDNATTSVALLAIARAWVKQPSRRSALFVFHGAEERGLLGSRYHAANPVVPLKQLAAVLNGDMIGRNHPDTAALLGSQPPHRNSMALVQMALDANRATGKFVIDSSWDRPDHPEGFYFRSDHVPYAERNVPAVYFTAMLHSDYHTPRDEPNNIDYGKLHRMTQWMYLTGWLAANSPLRPALDAGFVLH
jgi:Zn-dependent M28 family amino/carboxypeptidase